ncbi:MAG TPA: hypothetical protein VKA15_16995, partial [Isosphaeraceae bacterium]|nr:hypothetical protein [Isosphaeraceae bacterium]
GGSQSGCVRIDIYHQATSQPRTFAESRAALAARMRREDKWTPWRRLGRVAPQTQPTTGIPSTRHTASRTLDWLN